jgi:predicted nucleic acid-binding protein
MSVTKSQDVAESTLNYTRQCAIEVDSLKHDESKVEQTGEMSKKEATRIMNAMETAATAVTMADEQSGATACRLGRKVVFVCLLEQVPVLYFTRRFDTTGSNMVLFTTSLSLAYKNLHA